MHARFCRASLRWLSIGAVVFFNIHTLLAEPDCSGTAAQSELCQQYQAAMEARAGVQSQQFKLGQLQVADSSQIKLQSALELHSLGMTNFDNEQYGEAAKIFNDVADIFGEIIADTRSQYRELETLGDSLLESSDYTDAIEVFDELVRLQPEFREYRSKLDVAHRGIGAEAELRVIQAIVDSGDHVNAQKRLAQFPKDVWQREIQKLTGRTQQLYRADGFSRFMNQGFRYQDQEDWPAAATAFRNALKLDPSSSIAKESLAQADARVRSIQFRSLNARYESFVQNEDWANAKATLLDLEPFADDQQSHSVRVMRIDEIMAYERQLEQWTVALSSSLERGQRDRIKNFLAAEPASAWGNRIATKFETLRTLYEQHTTRHELHLVSDRRTEVAIVPGMNVGKFRKKTVMVYPGTYRLVGKRKGYHQVIQTISVPLADGRESVEVICRDRF